jgi:LysR family transcriptional regulator, transcriptional activator of the cysJI operon
MGAMGNFRLKVFRAVAKHLNFRRAAEELCLTQPAVTLQIKALEQDVGAQLFDRSGAHITLTPAGATLLKYAARIEKLEQEAQAAITPYSAVHQGEIRIAASLTIAQYILPHLLGAFQQQHPQVRPVVTTCNTEQVLEALVAHQVAIGFIEGPAMRRDVRTEVFLEDEIVLMVPPAHEWSERSFVDPEELSHERFLLREHGSGTRRVVEAALQKGGVKLKHLNLVMQIDSTEGIATAVEAGLGIGFASRWAISKQLHVGSLKVVPIRGIQIKRPLSFAHPLGQEPQGIALAFFTFMRSRHPKLIPPSARNKPSA